MAKCRHPELLLGPATAWTLGRRLQTIYDGMSVLCIDGNVMKPSLFIVIFINNVPPSGRLSMKWMLGSTNVNRRLNGGTKPSQISQIETRAASCSAGKLWLSCLLRT